MQPRRHPARGERRDHRMRQLVHDHAIELGQILMSALHRYANPAVEQAVGPLGRAGQIAKLLLGVKRHHDGAGRVGPNRCADAPVRLIQNGERTIRQRAVGTPLEDDRKPAVVPARQRAVER